MKKDLQRKVRLLYQYCSDQHISPVWKKTCNVSVFLKKRKWFLELKVVVRKQFRKVYIVSKIFITKNLQ